MSSSLLARRKAKLQVSGCQRCPLHKTCTQPVPYYGPPGAQIAVIGEAPGRDEDIHNRPFVGPAGQLARKWLTQAGIEPESAAWLNVVCCFPHRTPLKKEVDACADNLKAQLAAIQPSWVLVFGGVAASAFHPALKISEVRGQWWRPNILPTAWALATWHPAAVLRSRVLEEEAMADVRTFRFFYREEMSPSPADACIKCHEVVDIYWHDIPWCGKHWGQYKGTRGRGRPVMMDGDKRVAGGVEWIEPTLPIG